MDERNRWVTITDDDGVTRRYNLASMVALGISAREDTWGTGVALEEVYLMPKSKRLILQIHSVWASRPGSPHITGRRYHVADAEVAAMLYQRTGDERLLPLIPEGTG